ncbi:MAG: ComEC/Rec2 family competence protein [Nannocystaceae bacterium]
MRRFGALVSGCALLAVTGCVASDEEPPAPPIESSLPLERPAEDPPRPADLDRASSMKFHFIDIGQGDATLLEFPCGAVLIDTGGELNDEFDGVQAITDYLEAFFNRRPDLNRTLDLMVITHPHLDHVRAVPEILSRFTVRNVVDNGSEDKHDHGSDLQIDLHRWLVDHRDSVGYHHARASEIPVPEGLSNAIIDPIGSCDASPIDPKLTLLWGEVTEELDTYDDDPNNHSVALRVDFGQTSALFTGDLEFVGLSRLFDHFKGHESMFDVDIYQVGHHGSKNATTRYLMQAMTPELAVISAGPYERNVDWTARKYGHPNLEALRHLVDAKYGVSGFREEAVEVWVGLKGAWKNERKEVFERRAIERAVYTTGWDGSVVVTGYDNGWLDVETERSVQWARLKGNPKNGEPALATARPRGATP